MLLNDVHSQLNPTVVLELVKPSGITELQKTVRSACVRGLKISIAGGRHAMGAQQFSANSLHIDTTGMARVLKQDAQRGLLEIEAGADWPAIIAATHLMDGPNGRPWGIRQKQTGVDAVTLGGSISANAHGRGLLMQPLGDDIENLTLIDPAGDVLLCSREQNAELFSLVVGGYGMFGVIYAATLRLMPRLRIKRLVDIIDLDDAMNAVYRRADEGCLFGDFQFVIDDQADNFLRRGVFACYQPVADNHDASGTSADLNPQTWLQLLKLAHDDKKAAFKLYSQHYLSTDGNLYWSDTHQLSTYIPSYADFLAAERQESGAAKETLMIGEHYVPPGKIADFMQRAKGVLRERGVEVIYGTIRAIQQDRLSFLPWAKQDYACVIFNLRAIHTPEELANVERTFRGLIDAALECDGSFFLTYHRYANRAQVEKAYPQFREFLQKKRQYDPGELFDSTWYQHHKALFAG